MAEPGTLRIRVLGDIGQFQQQMGGLSGDLGKLGSNLMSAGRQMTLLTAPIAAIGAGAVATGMKFDSSFAKIQGLVGVAEQDIGELREGVLRLAGETARAPLELADALFFVTSAGFRGQEALDVLEISAKGSAAGLGETKDVANLLTSVINAYGAENITAARAGDILTATIREGKLETDSLAAVMGPLLPLASKLGISFDDLGGQYAVMSRTGAEAAGITTSLQAIMTSLLNPSVGAAKALADVGLSAGQLREVAAGPGGLLGVMRLLEERFAGNDEALTNVIPNIRAFRGVMSVLAQDGEIVDQVMGNVANSTGMLDEAFAVAAETAEFKFQQAIANSQVALLEVWEVIKGPVSDALDALSQMLKDAGDWFKNLDPGIQTAIVALSGLAIVLGPLLIFLGLLFTAVSVILSPVVLVGLAIAAVAIAIVLLLDKLNLLNPAIELAGQGFDAMRLANEILVESLLGIGDVIYHLMGALGEFAAAAEAAIRLDWDGVAAAQERAMARMQSAMEAAQGVVSASSTVIERDLREKQIRAAVDVAKQFDETMLAHHRAAAGITESSGQMSGAVVSAADLMELGMDQATAEMLADLSATEGGAADLGTTFQQTGQQVQRSLSDLSSALSGLGGDSKNYFKEFKNASKDLEDPEKRIKSLQKQINKLDKVDLASLPPAALAAWMQMRGDAQTELDGLSSFMDNKGDIIADILPEALGDSQSQSLDKWRQMFGDTKTYTGDMERNAAMKAALLSGKWSGEMEKTANNNKREWDRIHSDALTDMKGLLNDAERYGKNTAGAYAGGISAMSGRITAAARTAVAGARRVLEALSPPGPESPLHNIDKWGFRTLMAWAEGARRATAPLRQAVESALGGAVGALTPRLTPAFAGASAAPGSLGPITVNVTVNGVSGDPQAVGESVGDAVRRAFGDLVERNESARHLYFGRR